MDQKFDVASGLFLLNPENRVFLEQNKLPRPSGASYGCLILFLIPFLLAGAFLAYYSVREMRRYIVLSQSGQTAVGEYTDQYISTGEDNDSYTVSYQFAVNDRFYSGNQQVDKAFYYQVETGGKASILYHPADPTISTLAGHNESPIGILLFAVVWNIVIVVLFRNLILERQRHLVLYRTGRVVKGKLVSISSRVDSDDDFILTVEYHFPCPETGQVMTAKSDAVRSDLRGKSLPAAGIPVAVLYRSDSHFKML